MKAAEIIYVAHARAIGSYAPRWSTAPQPWAWRAAADAILAAIDRGEL